MIGDASLSNVHILRNPAGGGYVNKEAVRCLCKRKLACCWRMSSRELSSNASEPRNEDDLPVLVVGTDIYPPFSYLDENGSPSGIDVDILTEACRRTGFVPKFHYIN